MRVPHLAAETPDLLLVNENIAEDIVVSAIMDNQNFFTDLHFIKNENGSFI